jgi:hypothetical protein
VAVEPFDPPLVKVIFEHRGTDADSGFVGPSTVRSARTRGVMRRQMPVLQRNFYELWPSRNHEGTTERRVVRSQLRKLLAMMRKRGIPQRFRAPR